MLAPLMLMLGSRVTLPRTLIVEPKGAQRYKKVGHRRPNRFQMIGPIMYILMWSHAQVHGLREYQKLRQIHPKMTKVCVCRCEWSVVLMQMGASRRKEGGERAREG